MCFVLQGRGGKKEKKQQLVITIFITIKMKTVTTSSVWILAHPPCKAPTQSTTTQGPVSPVSVLSVGSDCGELLLNPAEDGEETEESEWVCQKVERSLLRCSRFLRTACYFHTRGRTKADTLLSDLLPSTASQRLLSQTLRRIRGSSELRYECDGWMVHPIASILASYFFFFFACGHFSAWKKCSRFGKRFVCRAHNYSKWTILNGHQRLRPLKQGQMKMDSGHVRTPSGRTLIKKKKKAVRYVGLSTRAGRFFCFVSFNWPDPCCLVTANVTFDWLMRLAPCLLSSRQSPVCGGGPCVRLVGRGQLRNDAARSRVAVNSDCTGTATCFFCWNK